MAYVALSFAPNEILTSGKMNQVAANFAALRDGTGMIDDSILNRHLADGIITGSNIASYMVRRQDDTTNSVKTAVKIQTGWGVVTYNAGLPSVTDAVTFPEAFTERPTVVATFGGDNPSSTAYGNGANLVEGIVASKAHSITTTGFTFHLHKGNGTNFAAGFGFYQWIAIGN